MKKYTRLATAAFAAGALALAGCAEEGADGGDAPADDAGLDAGGEEEADAGLDAGGEEEADAGTEG